MIRNSLRLLIFCLFCFHYEYASGSICPRACRCAHPNIVHCNERNLTLIPYNIPTDASTLYLQLNQVDNRPITNEVLSSLKDLIKLDLHHNQLTSVPKGLAKTLKYIDFRRNFIKYVGKTSLKGLTSLAELHLNQNNLTNHGLSPLAFEDTQSLRVLILSNNLLTKFPENLPSSLRLLRLNNNRINFVSRMALQRLKNLVTLDLSNNFLFQEGFQKHSLSSLTYLSELDLRQNLLTELPPNLPENIQELMLSHNQIEYLYSHESDKHGSFDSVKNLVSVDLSSNNLKSVETRALVNLRLQSVQLHNNPWVCDCHLRYLKEWIVNSKMVTPNSKINCLSPPEFAGVSLTNLDEEALKCKTRIANENIIDISDVTTTSFVVNWVTTFSDPPYIRRSIVYGPLKCENCTVAQFITSQYKATSVMRSYVSKEINPADHMNHNDVNFLVSKLQSNCRYAFCVFDSEQNINTVSLDQCLDVKTLPVGAALTADPSVVFIPLWSIVLWCAVFLLLITAVIGFVVWKRYKPFRSKTPQTRYSHDNGSSYYPDLLISARCHRTQRNTSSRSQTMCQGFPTNISERTYAECGPASLSARRASTNTPTDASGDRVLPIRFVENRAYSDRLPTPTAASSSR